MYCLNGKTPPKILLSVPELANNYCNDCKWFGDEYELTQITNLPFCPCTYVGYFDNPSVCQQPDYPKIQVEVEINIDSSREIWILAQLWYAQSDHTIGSIVVGWMEETGQSQIDCDFSNFQLTMPLPYDCDPNENAVLNAIW